MEKDFENFSIDTALLSHFLTYETKSIPTGLCPLTPSLIPTIFENNTSSLGSVFGNSMISPAPTPLIGPLTPGKLMDFNSAYTQPERNLKSKFYSLFPNYKRNSFSKSQILEKPDNFKLSHKEAEQRRRDEFKDKLANLKAVLSFKKHATKIQIIEMARETIVEQGESIKELEEMVRILLAERGVQ